MKTLLTALSLMSLTLFGLFASGCVAGTREPIATIASDYGLVDIIAETTLNMPLAESILETSGIPNAYSGRENKLVDIYYGSSSEGGNIFLFVPQSTACEVIVMPSPFPDYLTTSARVGDYNYSLEASQIDQEITLTHGSEYVDYAGFTLLTLTKVEMATLDNQYLATLVTPIIIQIGEFGAAQAPVYMARIYSGDYTVFVVNNDGSTIHLFDFGL